MKTAKTQRERDLEAELKKLQAERRTQKQQEAEAKAERERMEAAAKEAREKPIRAELESRIDDFLEALYALCEQHDVTLDYYSGDVDVYASDAGCTVTVRRTLS